MSKKKNEKPAIEPGEAGRITIELDRIKADWTENRSRQFYNDVQRKEWLDKNQGELVNSIRTQGLISPLIVVEEPKGGKFDYRLIGGFRRFEALKTIGKKSAPCVIWNDSEKGFALVNGVENMQRQNCTPYQTAKYFFDFMKDFKESEREMAKHLGKSHGYVHNLVKCIKDLHPKIVEEWANSINRPEELRGVVSTDRLIALCQLPKDAQLETFELKKIQVVRGVDADAAREIYAAEHGGKGPKAQPPEPPKKKKSKKLVKLRKTIMSQEYEDGEDSLYAARSGAVAMLDYLIAGKAERKIQAMVDKQLLVIWDPAALEDDEKVTPDEE